MKATGIIRKVDELGRVVLPIEMRRILGIEERDAVEICMEDEHIIVRKYENSCIFCGNEENLQEFKGKNVCDDCRKELQ